jgi:hypothetical protein
MRPDQIAKLPGYDLDMHRNREEARALMRKLGYGPGNRLKVKVTTRDWSKYRDCSARSSPRRYRQDFAIGNEFAANLLHDAYCFMSCPTHATASRKCENSIGADPGQQ